MIAKNTEHCGRIHVRITRDGKELDLQRNVFISFIGEYVGTIGNTACYESLLVQDFVRRRCGRRIFASTYRGPVTVEIVAMTGEVISRVAVCNIEHVAAHRLGKVAYAE
jgi:hypothetical protein